MMNRETWLNLMVEALRGDFEAVGYEIPEGVKVSCGWSSRGAKGKAGNSVLGECWSPECSAIGNHEIFMSPIDANPLTVGATLVHELIHAVIGIDEKHGKVFAKAAKALGLVGKMKSTTAGADLQGRLADLVEGVGPYPHAELKAMTNGKKKQATRMIKVVCPSCGYTCRIAQAWIDNGLPSCPEGDVMEIAQAV